MLSMNLHIKFWLTSLMTLISISVFAYDFEADGIYYNINVSDKTASVTFGDIKYSGNIVIPSKVTFSNQDMSVVEIGGNAFSYCKGLLSVAIPESIIKIEADAFADSDLVSIEIPNTVIEMGPAVFYSCSLLESVILPNNISIIDSSTFAYCT